MADIHLQLKFPADRTRGSHAPLRQAVALINVSDAPSIKRLPKPTAAQSHPPRLSKHPHPRAPAPKSSSTTYQPIVRQGFEATIIENGSLYRYPALSLPLGPDGPLQAHPHKRLTEREQEAKETRGRPGYGGGWGYAES
ncbi:hypothetical protein NMY22_g11883 [Coprinellus aureogranulatus]|nr:hypothetical protein NMY22_g11883 [Coprinellus aureogranulatus]